MAALNSNDAGMRVGMSINDVTNNAPSGYNRFDESYQMFITPRFGEVTPHFVLNSVGKANVDLSSHHEVRTYTLAAPLMSQLRMHKAYYDVPKHALMPRTWSKFFANPQKGDDVPDDTQLAINLDVLEVFLKDLWTKKDVWDTELQPDQLRYIRACLLPYLFYSKSSLLVYLKEPLWSSFGFTKDGSTVDCDTFMDGLFQAILAEPLCNGATIVKYNPANDNDEIISTLTYDGTLSSLRELIFSLLFDGGYSFSTETLSANGELFGIFNTYYNSSSVTLFFTEHDPLEENCITVDRPLAYQMVCSQFFTNPDIDYVFTSELFLNNTEAIYFRCVEEIDKFPNFDYNGLTVLYDLYSLRHNNNVLSQDMTDNLKIDYIFGYFSNLLGFRNSLRYVDYFTGGRVAPLAVGDINIPVTGSNVSAIDVTKGISMQRFLHAVNRTSQQFWEYLKGIFGYKPMTIPPMPRFLARETYGVSGSEVANTIDLNSEVQASPLGRLVKNISFTDSKYDFLAYIDQESILIGVIYFDYIPAYETCIDKHCFHMNRFDMFQPYLQTIGDQMVEERECSIARKSLASPWSYQLRNMEYKQRFSAAAGGFLGYLPSWALTRNLDESRLLNVDTIRQRNSDIDRLYSSLTGTNLASYFHFIVSNNNECYCNYPMLRKPQIL